MNAGAKLAAYGLGLAAALGGGAAVGTVAGPLAVDGAVRHTSGGEAGGAIALPAGGLLVSEDGYRLVPGDRLADAGPFTFAIVGPDGHAVTRYDVLDDRQLHLVVASRDLLHYAHLHPTRDAAGRWSVALPALAPGPYRAFADFRPAGGRQHTLGVDLVNPGPAEAPPPLEPAAADSVDGFDVTLEHHDGDVVTVTVRRDGAVVATQPYLGAAGHLVAIRDGDLAYLHVHPMDGEAGGPVRFAVDVPSAGTYALFFDFRVDGVVRTARFVVDVQAGHRAAGSH